MISSRYPIVLARHDPAWATRALRLGEALRGVVGDAMLAVHHIGSTAIAGIRAKPIVDLLPVVGGLEEIDAKQASVEAAGYVWLGECGIAGRRYCVLVEGGRRIAQLHVFAAGAPDIARYLAFRDYLRARPDEARAYEAEKLRAQALHPGDVLAYADEKSAWIRGCLERAAVFLARAGGGAAASSR